MNTIEKRTFGKIGNSVTSRNKWLVLVAVLIAYIPIVIDMTILHVAIPSLSLALAATANEVL